MIANRDDEERRLSAEMLRGSRGAGQWPKRIGLYEVLDLIGEGGMGEVFLGCHPELPRRVAIKVIKKTEDPAAYDSFLKRFEAERRMLAVLRHRNIVTILDAGRTEDGRPYLVMDHVNGQPLTRHCDAQKLSIRRRVELFIGVCNAVQHAHEKGIIHRDLKPSNVLIEVEDGVEVPKVIDFGIAKIIRDDFTHTMPGSVVGTLLYMSPEQAEPDGEGVDTRSDIYSLGVLLHELLIGVNPVESDRRRAATGGPGGPPGGAVTLHGRLASLSDTELQAVAHHRGVRAQALKRLIWPELDAIVARAMQRERSDRYPSASEVSNDLTHLLRNEPVTALSGRMYRARKLMARHWLPVAVGVFIFTSLAVATILLARAYSEKQDALAEKTEALRKEEGLRSKLEDASKLREDAVETSRQERETARSMARDELSSRVNADGLSARLAAQTLGAERKAIERAVSTFEGARRLLAEGGGVPREAIEGAVAALNMMRRSFPLQAHADSVSGVMFWEREGQVLITTGLDGVIAFWSVDERCCLERRRHEDGPVFVSDFSPRPAILATCGRTGARLHTLERKAPAICGGRASFVRGEGWLARPRERIEAIAFSGDGRHFASGSREGRVEVLDLESGRRPSVPPRQLAGEVRRLAFAPQGFAAAAPQGFTLLAAVGTDAVLLRQSTEGNPKLIGRHSARINWAEFSPDGSAVATASDDHTVGVWNVDGSGWSPRLRPELTGHVAQVLKVQFEPGGRLLLSTSADGTARVWDWRARRLLSVCSPHGGAVWDAAYFPQDGSRFLTACDGGELHSWSIEMGSFEHESWGQSEDSRNDVRIVRFSRGSPNVAVTANRGGGVRLWSFAPAQASSQTELSVLLEEAREIQRRLSEGASAPPGD